MNTIKIGEIYMVDLGPTVDHRIAKNRPCVIVDLDRHTASVIAITENKGSALHRSEIPISNCNGVLLKDSKLKLSQITTVDINKIGKYIGDLPVKYLGEVREYIKRQGLVWKLSRAIKRINKKFNPTINK